MNELLHEGLWVASAIYDTDGILVCMRIVRHEAFEVWLLYIVFLHNFIKFSPHNTLDLHVLQLHVTQYDGYNLAIPCIVYMTHHCGPCLDMLDIVKHEPRIF